MMYERLTDRKQKQFGELIHWKLLVDFVHLNMTINRHSEALSLVMELFDGQLLVPGYPSLRQALP